VKEESDQEKILGFKYAKAKDNPTFFEKNEEKARQEPGEIRGF
jgi:hypothetical protein